MILVNAVGVGVIVFIIWWFWLAKPRAQRAAGAQVIAITVADGVYTPARIEVPAGAPVTLRFLRKDPSPCAEKVVFDDLGITADLSVGQAKEITVQPERPGEYEFTCQMRMYRGRLVARSSKPS